MLYRRRRVRHPARLRPGKLHRANARHGRVRGVPGQLAFEPEPNLVITLEGSYEQIGPPDEGWRERVDRLGDDSRLRRSSLMQLTNYEIAAAAAEDERSFRLEFENGQTLRLIDDSERYESMQIHHGERIWVI